MTPQTNESKWTLTMWWQKQLVTTTVMDSSLVKSFALCFGEGRGSRRRRTRIVDHDSSPVKWIGRGSWRNSTRLFWGRYNSMGERNRKSWDTSFAKHSGMLYSQELARFSYISPSHIFYFMLLRICLVSILEDQKWF